MLDWRVLFPYTPIINPISFLCEFFFKWSEIFRSDFLGHWTPEYDFFFDLVDFQKKIESQKKDLRQEIRLTSRNWKKRGGLSTHHRKIAITLRIFYQWGSSFQRILTIYRTSIYHKFGVATKLLKPKMLFSQSYDYSNITKIEIVIDLRKKYFGLQIFRIWQIP